VPGGAPRAARWRGTLLAVAAVGASLAAVRRGSSDALDQRLGAAMAVPRGRALDRLVGVTTDLGSVYGLAGVAGVLAATGHRRRATEVTAAGLLAWSAAQASKPLASRPRPYQAALAQRLVAEPAGSSWPSGHTAVVTAMAGSLARDVAPPARLAVGVVALGVACSRLYVGVHHPTDLVAGAGVGALSVRVVGTLRARLER
jgi:membrane-associated phospholipid phosphatase